MIHLLKISQFLYFQLISIFLLLLYLHNNYSWADTNSFIYVFFSLLLIPVIDALLSGVFSRLEISHIINKKNIIWFVLYIGVNVLLYILGYFTLPLFLSVSVIYTIMYNIDGRIYFLWALLTFLYVMLWLILWDASFAEWLSILAYYFLIAGVVTQIFENISFPKSSSHA